MTHTVITLQSGKVRLVKHEVAYPVLGLDAEGRVVVQSFEDSTFGLTLCCDAFDKGSEGGVVCRACYGMSDVGVYDPEVVDPVVKVEVTDGEEES